MRIRAGRPRRAADTRRAAWLAVALTILVTLVMVVVVAMALLPPAPEPSPIVTPVPRLP